MNSSVSYGEFFGEISIQKIEDTDQPSEYLEEYILAYSKEMIEENLE